MKTSDLLLDFIESLGYDINLIELPASVPITVTNADASKVVSLITFRRGRDGVEPSVKSAPNWCTLNVFKSDSRLAFTITIDEMPFWRDPYSSQTMFLDNPDVFTNLTVFLDHWYFRVFHKD